MQIKNRIQNTICAKFSSLANCLSKQDRPSSVCRGRENFSITSSFNDGAWSVARLLRWSQLNSKHHYIPASHSDWFLQNLKYEQFPHNCFVDGEIELHTSAQQDSLRSLDFWTPCCISLFAGKQKNAGPKCLKKCVRS